MREWIRRGASCRPGAWLNSSEFEQAREFVFEEEPTSDEQSWILYAPVGPEQAQPAEERD